MATTTHSRRGQAAPMAMPNDLQPWFYCNLGSSTTDDIETRICITWSMYASGAVVVDQLELYIQ